METRDSHGSAGTLRDWVGAVSVRQPIVHERMTLFPAYTDRPAAPFEYVTLAEALKNGWVTITEKPQASVPELLLVNTGDKPVLLLDGEEVVGGRQNRVLNICTLVNPRSEVLLPVSCVELGRWHDVSAHFAVGEMSSHQLKREMHEQVNFAMAAQGRASANQEAVWERIGGHNERAARPSPTQAMHDIYADRDDALVGYERAFAYPEGAVGMVVAIGGNMAGAELFDRPVGARANWRRLVRSFAFDAIEATPGAPVTADRPRRMLERVQSAVITAYPSPARGENLRVSGNGLIGSALMCDGWVVYASLFRRRNGRGRGEGISEGELSESRMASFHQRLRTRLGR
jgi:hypothetical protein